MKKTESGLFVPGKKIPDRVKELARVMFVEAWKDWVRVNDGGEEFDATVVYRVCVAHASAVDDIEQEER